DDRVRMHGDPVPEHALVVHDHVRVEEDTLAELAEPTDTRTGEERRARADLASLADNRERTECHAWAQSGRGVDVRGRVDRSAGRWWAAPKVADDIDERHERVGHTDDRAAIDGNGCRDDRSRRPARVPRGEAPFVLDEGDVSGLGLGESAGV